MSEEGGMRVLYQRFVRLARNSWSPKVLLWIDIFLAKKLFVVSIPSNFNYWRSKKSITKLLKDHKPLTIVDVGSRGAPPPELQQIRPFARYIGFDASDTAQDHSLSHLKGWQDYSVIQAFIGKQSSSIEFKNYTDGGLSSALEPNGEYVREFAPSTSVESREFMPTRSLAEVLGSKMREIDFLKLDTQGTELDILTTDGVTEVPLLEVETEFIEVYEGQSLFGEVFEHLISSGYRLLWLSRHFGSPSGTQYFGRGSLVFGEALFGFSTKKAHDLDDEKFRKYVTLLSVYGHADFAEFLVKTKIGLAIEVQMNLREVIQLFSQGERTKGHFKMKFSSALEKVQFLSGFSRGRHNRFDSDSDRSIFFR